MPEDLAVGSSVSDTKYDADKKHSNAGNMVLQGQLEAHSVLLQNFSAVDLFAGAIFSYPWGVGAM
jgi:hypothetical protein